MTQLFAQPYSIAATGFYFEDYEEYSAKAAKAQDDYGQPVEEFEIQFIDGDEIDCVLANAIGLDQANLAQFLQFADEWEEEQKQRCIIAVGEYGYSFEEYADNPDEVYIDLYYLDSIKELAEQFVEEGLYGDIPESLQFYIDIEAMARDLAVDYAHSVIAGQSIIYRCA